jgi:hypothetical protein
MTFVNCVPMNQQWGVKTNFLFAEFFDPDFPKCRAALPGPTTTANCRMTLPSNPLSFANKFDSPFSQNTVTAYV